MVPILGTSKKELPLKLILFTPTIHPDFKFGIINVLHTKGSPLTNCFDFTYGPLIKINIPKHDQRIWCKGCKRVYGLKFRSLALPNAIIANLPGPYEGKRHNRTMFQHLNL